MIERRYREYGQQIIVSGTVTCLRRSHCASFCKLMFDMNRSMSEMTEYVGAISRDVSEMQNSMQTMNDSLLRMEKTIHDLGKAFIHGSKQIQQMNPAGMLQQVLPDRDQRTR